MNFFGIGNLELVVILLVALLVFGPERMLDMARRAGRFWREAQATIRYAIDTATTEEERKNAASTSSEPVPPPDDVVERPSQRAVAPPDGQPTSSNGHTPLTDEDPLRSKEPRQRG